MKLSPLSPIVFLLATALVASARTFTATDGRSLEGEIREANDKEVTIRMTTTSKDVVVPLDRLIPAHQQEIRQWRRGKALAKITVSATKDKETSNGVSRGGSASALDTKAQTWSWVITVKNGSPYPVSGLSLDWSQVVERTDRNQGGYSGPSKTVARFSHGMVPVPDIPAFGSVKVKTAPISVQSMKSVSSSYSTSTSGRTVETVTSYKWDEALSGLGVEVKNGPDSVLRWKTGTDPLNTRR